MKDKYYKLTDPSKIHKHIVGYREGERLYFFDISDKKWEESSYRDIHMIKMSFAGSDPVLIEEAEAALLFGAL